jgi:lipid II:glycine glycyltransferase (peptidoglycan interpeptide bridge formation enzyme)
MPYILLKNEVNLITKNFNDSLKKGIRKCEKNNIEVIFTSNKSDILKYEEILKYHRDTLNFDMPFMYPSLANIDIFRNQRITCEVGLAFYGDKLLAGLGFLEFNKLLIEVGSAQGPLYNKLKLPAFEFIKIKAIEKYKENGCEIYDLMGVKKNPLTIKEKNIKNFKSKFTKSKGHSSYISGETFRPIEYFFRRIKRKLNL